MERRIDKLRQSSRQLVWALALTLVAAMPAFAQFERGTISGTIKDAQGGVMPGVTVTATNQQTQQAVSVTTDDSGFYNFANLTPGRYNMSAELQGFKKVVRNDVQLDAAGSINIDFDLQTGELTEEVTVTAEAAPLQTDVALRKTVESKDIEQMSFSGRNPIGVAGLKAGVVGGSFNSYGFASLSNGGYNINGSRARREQHHGRRRDGHPHAFVRRRDRRAERRRDPGSPGADRQLHAGIRPRLRRSDPHGDEERRQPLLRQRVVLPPRRVAPGQQLGAQPQHEPAREQRPGAVRLQAVRLFVRRSHPRLDVQGQAVLLRRAGVGELLPGLDGDHHGADRG